MVLHCQAQTQPCLWNWLFLKCCVPALCTQNVFLESGFSLFLPQISVSLSLFHAQHYIFLFCHCIFWGSNLLRPAVSNVHVLEGMAFDARPLQSIGLIYFKVCWPWCNFALHLQLSTFLLIRTYKRHRHTRIHMYTHRYSCTGCELSISYASKCAGISLGISSNLTDQVAPDMVVLSFKLCHGHIHGSVCCGSFRG